MTPYVLFACHRCGFDEEFDVTAADARPEFAAICPRCGSTMRPATVRHLLELTPSAKRY